MFTHVCRLRKCLKVLSPSNIQQHIFKLLCVYVELGICIQTSSSEPVVSWGQIDGFSSFSSTPIDPKNVFHHKSFFFGQPKKIFEPKNFFRKIFCENMFLIRLQSFKIFFCGDVFLSTKPQKKSSWINFRLSDHSNLNINNQASWVSSFHLTQRINSEKFE